jgi:hypothetical protein
MKILATVLDEPGHDFRRASSTIVLGSSRTHVTDLSFIVSIEQIRYLAYVEDI